MNPNEPQNGPQPSAPQELPPVPVQPVSTPFLAEQPESVVQTQPDSQAAMAPQAKHQQYDFILNPAPASKKSFLSGGNPMKLLAVVGGGALVIIILGVVLTTLFAKGSTSPLLTTIVQEQQELIRIAAQAESQSTSESVRGLAYNVDLSVGSSKSQLSAYLTKQGTKLNEKQLALKRDAATDQLLTNAKATSTYDSALKKVLVSQLQTYLSDLKKAYNQTSSKSLRTILNSSYESGKTLLTQAQSSAADTTQ